MSNNNDDMIPEWQSKSNPDPTPRPNAGVPFPTQQQPGQDYRAFSDPYQDYSNGPVVPKQSGLGIASFIMGALGAVLAIVLFVVMVGSVMDYVSPSGAVDYSNLEENYGGLVGAGLGIMATLFMMFIGLILGIVGLVQKGRKKGFAIAGTIINGLFVCGLGLLMLIGILNS